MVLPPVALLPDCSHLEQLLAPSDSVVAETLLHGSLQHLIERLVDLRVLAGLAAWETQQLRGAANRVFVKDS